jgi:acyl-CoA thioesterase
MIDRETDPIKHARDVVGKDPFSRFLGMEVEEVRESYAKVSLTIKEEYCNAESRTHGGVLFSVADQALGVAINSRGYLAFGVEVKINYFDAARPGDVIFAEATPVDIRTRISLWNIEVTNQRGDRIALAHGLAYHVRE